MRALLVLLSRHVEDNKEVMDAEVYINGLRQDVRKPPVHMKAASSLEAGFEPNLETHLTVLFSVASLICLVALRTTMKRRLRGTGVESTPLTNNARGASPRKLSPPPSSFFVPSSPIAEELNVRKVAPKTPSKLERQLEQQLEQDDTEEIPSDGAREFSHPLLSFGDDFDEEDNSSESFFTALFGSGRQKDMNRADGTSHAREHVEESQQPQVQSEEEEEDEVNNGIGMTLLPSPGAIPARSGFRKSTAG